MFWIIFCISVFLTAVLFLLYLYRRDRHYEKKPPSAVMSDSLWDELAKEREETLLKAKKFKEALKNAKNRI